MRGRIVAVVGVLVVLLAGWLVLRPDGTNSSAVTHVLAVDLPRGWTSSPPTAEDRGNGVIRKLVHPQPAASVVVRAITGELSGDVDLDAVARQTEAALRQAAQGGFESIDRSVVQVDNRDAIRIAWREGSGDTATRSLMTIVPRQDQTFYLTLRAGATEFDAVREAGEQLLHDLSVAAAS